MPPVPPPAPPPPAPADPVLSTPMTVDDEQSRVLEWTRHATRQAPGGLGRAVGELLRRSKRRNLRTRKKTTRATMSQGETLCVKRADVVVVWRS